MTALFLVGVFLAISPSQGQERGCVRRAPLLSLSGPALPVKAGQTQVFIAALTNKDSPQCKAVRFSVATRFPAQWWGVLSPEQVALEPGQTTTVTLQVTALNDVFPRRAVAVGVASSIPGHGQSTVGWLEVRQRR